jgi:hypothetical protein
MIEKGRKNLSAEFFKNSPKKMKNALVSGRSSISKLSNPVFGNLIRPRKFRNSSSEDEGVGSEPNTPELNQRTRKFASPAKVCSKNLMAMVSSFSLNGQISEVSRQKFVSKNWLRVE